LAGLLDCVPLAPESDTNELPSELDGVDEPNRSDCYCSVPQHEPAKGSSDHQMVYLSLSAQLVFIGDRLELARDREAVKLSIGMGE
jgi:hypothetical protein